MIILWLLRSDPSGDEDPPEIGIPSGDDLRGGRDLRDSFRGLSEMMMMKIGRRVHIKGRSVTNAAGGMGVGGGAIRQRGPWSGVGGGDATSTSLQRVRGRGSALRVT